MKTYRVRTPLNGTASTTVEAENAEQAKTIAAKQIGTGEDAFFPR
jgi:hypothetical protein